MELKKIRYLASLFFSKEEIAIMLDNPDLKILLNQDTEQQKQYNKGFLNSRIKYRKSIIQDANAGNPIAIDELNQIILQTKIKNQ